VIRLASASRVQAPWKPLVVIGGEGIGDYDEGDNVKGKW
jgi:hypothetical protein